MKNLLLLLTLVFICMAIRLPAQIELKLLLQPGGTTYTVLARSQVDFLPPLDNLTHSAQVTLVVPTGTFQPVNLQSHAGQWQLSNLIQHPAENPGADYAIFSLAGATADIEFEAGQEAPLFSFENENGCTGALEIMDHFTDPFLPPNSLNAPVGNEFFVEGAGGDAYVGNYDTGSANCFLMANCLISFELELLPNGFYQISLVPDAALPASAPVEMLQATVKVPTGFFQTHDLTNLLPGVMTFGGVARFDSPVEDQNSDYFRFRMNASGPGLTLQPGVKIPLLKFANGGSCQGDSIFLVKNDDPFLPPNSQGADIGQFVKFAGTATSEIACAESSTAAAPCAGCLFTAGILKIDSLQTADPVVCLGGNDGMIRIFAHGAAGLQFSIDGGQNWSADSHFGGLQAGNYEPVVRGIHLACLVEAAAATLQLLPNTVITPHLDVPPAACEGSDLQLKITSPSPLPANAAYQWSGPAGFNAAIPDPVIFDVNQFQSGTYTLTIQAPGCDAASASAALQVNALPPMPSILSNGPICFGEKLEISTDAAGEKFEWLSPAGSGAATLALPGLTTAGNSTLISPNHPAYLSGNWKVRVTEASGCTAVSDAVAVNIKPRPQAFAENGGPVCPGGQAQLLGNSLPGAVYQWKKQGQSTVFSMQPNPVLANVLASQTFELQVTQDGCVSENSASTTISLSPEPELDPTASYTPAADCSPKNLQLTANATGPGLSYQWLGVNGFASQLANPAIPNATAAANGSYQLEVTNIFGCKASESLQVTQVVDPVPTPVLQSTGAACPGEDIELSTGVYSGPQVSYQWFRNGNSIYGQTSNSLILSAVQPSVEGMYRVRVTVGNCVVQSAELPVDVLDKPVAAPNFYLTQPCEGGSLQFFSNLNGNAAWHWTGPNGFLSDSPNPLIYNTEFDDIGAYSLTVTGSNGCESTASVVVDGILPEPDAPVVATNSPVCPEGEIVLTVQNPVLAGTVDFEWMNGAGESIGFGDPTLVLNPSDPQAVPPFLVKTIVNTCPSVFSDPIPVEVKPKPQAIAWNGGEVCAGETAQLFAATAQGVSYEWRVPGGATVVSIEQNPVLPVQDSTVFELTVGLNGCQSTDTALTLVPVHPVPEISGLTGGGAHCEGAPVTLSAVSTTAFTGPVQYTWTGPGGFSFTAPAAAWEPFPLAFGSVGPQNEGAYTLTLESAAGCVSAAQSVTLEVGEMPPPPMLTVADAVLCQGETLQLDASPLTGSSVEYRWFFNDGSSDFLLAATSFPTYFLPFAMPSNSGIYFVKTQVDGCEPPPSNLAAVTVLGPATNVQASNPTTSLTPVCEGSDVQLDATLIPGASYHWYGPAGFFADVPNPLLTNVEEMNAGSYLVLVSLPDCPVTMAVSTTVFIQPAPETPVLTGVSEACEGSDVEISVANLEPGAAYRFYFGQNLQPMAGGTGGSLFLGNVPAAQSGVYSAMAELNGCASDFSEKFHLEIVPMQTGLAFAGEDRVVCDKNEIQVLQATPPAVGSGYWTALDGATVVQPNSPISPVLNLGAGGNRFLWTLTNGICPGAGVDTTMIFVEEVEVADDEFAVPAGGNLLDVNLLANDLTQNFLAWEFFISKKPSQGKLLDDGTGLVTFEPYPNAFGVDSFTYKICSMSCPDVCGTALVRLTLGGSAAAADCFIPNLVTPNGDGENDMFVIPCAVGWPGSSLVVFNRWGSKVFESKNYENDWDGAHDGQPLPAGTYFYRLTLNDGQGSVRQGYVVVMR